MTTNRVKQFFNLLNAKMQTKDIKFVENILNKDEQQLFFKLSEIDQKHCVRVAMDVKEECEKNKINNSILVKAALLHDIGKLHVKLNVIDKSILVILNKLSSGKLKRFEGISKVDIYYNHAEKGYKLLKDKCVEDKILFLIKNHHIKEEPEDLELKILKKCDDRN